MRLNRRGALGVLGLTAGACASPADQNVAAADVRFLHGVASGDPATGSVVLWTAVTVPPDPPQRHVWVEAEIAESEDFAHARRLGRGMAGAASGWTFKTIAEGLKPGTDYWYRFRCGEAVSPVGRTRTLPDATSTDPVTFAVASCSQFTSGFFNAYTEIARMERLDAVIFLGDYIYEYGYAPGEYGAALAEKLGRMPEPIHECVTLDDYRARIAQARREPELQAAHARAPWIVAFDDHEITNDPWTGGAQNHQPDTEGDWAARKAAALTAWFEWMPIRPPAARDADSLARASERSFHFGRSASLHMLETRLLARSQPLDYATDYDPQAPEAFRARLNAPDRSLMGEAQLQWLERECRTAVDAGCAWQVLGNQVVMARVDGPRLPGGMTRDAVDAAVAAAPDYRRASLARRLDAYSHDLPLNVGYWDGYPAERERLYAALKRAGARPAVVSGDSHTFWINSLSDADGRFVGPEFATSAISSAASSTRTLLPGEDMRAVIESQSAEVDMVEFVPRGFVRVTATPDWIEGEPIGMSTVESRDYSARSLGVWRSERGASGLSSRPART